MAGLNIHRIPSRVEGQELPITQVDISEMDRNVFAYGIYMAFRHFGEIHDICMSANVGLTVSFIALSLARKVQLLQRRLTMGDRQYNVHVLDSSSTLYRPNRRSHTLPANLLRPADDQQSSHNILVALNDDCLLEIFRRLHLLDLLSVARVCTRFRRIAIEAFHARYTRDQPFCYFDLNYGDGVYDSLSAVEQCLRTFNPVSVDLPGQLNENVVLRLMADHCTQLDDLDLLPGNLEPTTLWALHPLMPKLRRLKICASLVEQCKANETDDWQLERLFVDGLEFNSMLPNIKMPKLTELTVSNYMDGFANEEFCEFFAKNAKIERLCFSNCRISLQQLYLISEYVANLKGLCLDICMILHSPPDSARLVDRFSELEYCRLQGNYYTAAGDHLGLVDGAPITHLQVHADRGDCLVDHIATFTTIRRLELEFVEQTIDDAELIRMTGPLANLQELFIVCADVTLNTIRRVLEATPGMTVLRVGLSPYGQIPIDADDCAAIAAIVAARPGLWVRIQAVRASIQDPDNLAHRYKDWLIIWQRFDGGTYDLVDDFDEKNANMNVDDDNKEENMEIA